MGNIFFPPVCSKEELKSQHAGFLSRLNEYECVNVFVHILYSSNTFHLDFLLCLSGTILYERMWAMISVQKQPRRFKCADGFKVLLNWTERIDGLLSRSLSGQCSQPELHPPLPLSLSLSLSDILMQFISLLNAAHSSNKCCFNCALQPALCLFEAGIKCHTPLAACQVPRS